jgi:hypothetical protein
VRRIVVIALSVMLALVVALPMAFGQTASAAQKPSSPQRNLADLTAEWWNWGFSTSPSPLDGSYTGGTQCEGQYIEGVFFLAGAGGSKAVDRTCTVPADTPILFPVSNVICSAAFDPIQEVDDPKPYDKKCAEPITDDVIDPPSEWYATLDGQDLEQQRIASGLFQWTIASDDNPFGLTAGTYLAGSDGLWVYLEEGLTAGEHTIVFGGRYRDTPFGSFKGARVTYHLTAV